jgi:nicotinate dehydrogenase subunit A
VIRLAVNGRDVALQGAASARLLDALRDELGLVGTRLGCGSGECGACHVLIDGRSAPSCDTPLAACAGRSVVTVEGLDSRLRDAFVAEQAAQCGFCSSGMLVAAAALLRTNPDPGEAEIKAALDRHLCRCGVHNRIVRAVRRAAA